MHNPFEGEMTIVNWVYHGKTLGMGINLGIIIKPTVKKSWIRPIKSEEGQ